MGIELLKTQEDAVVELFLTAVLHNTSDIRAPAGIMVTMVMVISTFYVTRNAPSMSLSPS